jgi:phage terminase small subunit
MKLVSGDAAKVTALHTVNDILTLGRIDMSLNRRQEEFVTEYLNCWNASEAARRAGYSLKTAGKIGQENLQKPEIVAEIERRISERQIKPAEVLQRLTEHARSDMSDFVTIDPTTGRATIDLAAAKSAGKLHLVKKVRFTRQGTEVELYDAQAALEKLGKALGVLRDNVTVNQEGSLEIVTRVVRKDDAAR